MDQSDPVSAEEPAAGENICPDCSGSGRSDGGECPTCGGSGKIVEPVGGA